MPFPNPFGKFFDFLVVNFDVGKYALFCSYRLLKNSIFNSNSSFIDKSVYLTDFFVALFYVGFL